MLRILIWNCQKLDVTDTTKQGRELLTLEKDRQIGGPSALFYNWRPGQHSANPEPSDPKSAVLSKRSTGPLFRYKSCSVGPFQAGKGPV
jgi:hypothetical protein